MIHNGPNSIGSETSTIEVAEDMRGRYGEIRRYYLGPKQKKPHIRTYCSRVGTETKNPVLALSTKYPFETSNNAECIYIILRCLEVANPPRRAFAVIFEYLGN